MMSGYKDATGHLLALRDEIPSDWFVFACDFALAATDDSLTNDDSNKLVSMFCQKEKYTPKPAASASAPIPTPVAASPTTTSPIKQLTDFTNFKKLSSTLEVTFDKRITLIFGANGSGKSSVCESIKMLASPSPPEAPLKNVYGSLLSRPSFSYRFDPDTATSHWDETHGYGAFASRIKYFDSTIAISHVTDALHPEFIVEISPFRLEVFDYCRSFVKHLRDNIASMIEEAGQKIDADVTVVSSCFADVSDQYKTAINELSSRAHAKLDQELKDFKPLTADDTQQCGDAKQALSRLTEASTEQGLKVLRSESSDLRRLHRLVAKFVDLCHKASPDRYKKAVKELANKKITQHTLAADILPEGVAVDQFKSFLDTSGEVFTFPGQEGDPCPFCRRPLEGESLDLVQKYHAFIVSKLQQEIATLTDQINDGSANLCAVRDFTLDIDDDASSILSSDQRQEIVKLIGDVKKSIPNPLPRDEEPTFGSFDNYVPLEMTTKLLGEEADKRDETIQIATSGSTDRQKEIARLTAITQQHVYRQKLSEKLDDLKEILSKCKTRLALQELVDLTDFPTILRRMTNAGKEAHTELVVAEFEKSLDKEYVALSGKSLADFGIRLKSRGEQQSIAVETQIGDTPIKRVLSEGEQKVHALALFFCEAVAKPCDIFIFDDPSTSFDYNHLGYFVERLRDLAHQFPESQFIIFTHNWDLFVQIQVVFNKARLNNAMEIKVMENCTIVESYSEKVDDLKQQITDMLALPGDFDSGQREKISGLMRRLLESVVNKYVFNGLRYQFKQRSQSVSVFEKFVRLVPLTHTEAQKLSDVYGHLSVSEHDDPRNIYVSRNKTSFQRWYDEIVDIATDLQDRRST